MVEMSKERLRSEGVDWMYRSRRPRIEQRQEDSDGSSVQFHLEGHCRRPCEGEATWSRYSGDPRQELADRTIQQADFLVHSGVKTLIDAKHAIAHNKVMVIDSETVITGSFNFTKAAEDHNAENLLVIHDKALTDKHTQN